MRGYITRRLLLIIPTVLLATLMVFFVVHLIPGDIIDLMIAENPVGTTGDVTRQALEHDLGLDVPIHVQYVQWLGDIFLYGDLGDSLWTSTSVTEEILSRLPVTFELGLMALVVALLIALPIGVYSAIRQDTVGDYIARSFAILCIAVPGFWLGTMVVVFPSLWWGWSPPIMVIPFTEDPMGNLGMFILPAVVLGMALAGVTMRMSRTMMLEVLRQDYIRTAWSKGLRERIVATAQQIYHREQQRRRGTPSGWMWA